MNVILCTCGKHNAVGSRFCSSCGTSLTGFPVGPASQQPAIYGSTPHSGEASGSTSQQTQTGGTLELPPGTRLSDRFTIVRLLGQGGFGKVYLAEDARRFNEKVVIKELSPGVQGTVSLLKAEELFQREAQTLYKLQHDQIPKFWEIFRDRQGVFLVQDFVEGSTYKFLLQQRRSQGQYFSEAEILQLFRKILPVLSYIHSQGVVHRDISPDNIIQRDRDKEPVLIDFGGVKELTLTVATQISYMNSNSEANRPSTCLVKSGFSPDEQYRGVVAHHSDLYALAATALCLMTGKYRPTQELWDDSRGWLWQQEIAVSPTLGRALEGMLAKKPAQRFQSAAEVLQCLNERSSVAPPSGRSPHDTVIVSRPKILPFVGIAAALVAIGLGFAFKDKVISSNPNINPTPTSTTKQSPTVMGAFGGDDTLNVGFVITSRFPQENYQALADYLKSELSVKLNKSVKIEIEGIDTQKKQSLKSAKNQIASKKWDLAFTVTPMLSIAAKDNGYAFVARMWPGSTQIESALFVRTDSPIQSLNDLTPDTTIALGDFNNAFGFYMPLYDLYGKTIKVDVGNNNSEITEKVKAGQADVGAGINTVVQRNTDLRRIGVSRSIPGAGAYLSPNLSPEDMNLVKDVLLNAPPDIRKNSNYAPGEEIEYAEFRKIVRRVDEILTCTNLEVSPVQLFCSDAIEGKVNGIAFPSSGVIHLTLQGNGQVYRVVLSQQILNQIPDAPEAFNLKGKTIRAIGVQPSNKGGTMELEITDAEQLKILD